MSQQQRWYRCVQAFVLVATLLVPGAGPVAAHPITVDGDPSDWVMAKPPLTNLGHIARNAAGEGEYVWDDVQGDERTDFAAPDTRVDIVDFRVTGDTTGICFLVRMANIDVEIGNGAPQVQIAIDRDFAPGSGNEWFAGFADTKVNNNARWEYLVQTMFGSAATSTTQVRVWDVLWNSVLYPTETISAANDTIEIRVPWAAIDGPPFPTPERLRFTVATFRCDTSDNTWDVGGGTVSNALDCVTNYWDPGRHAPPPTGDNSQTWNEVSDQVVDYHFDVWWEPDFDPKAPLLVNEVMYWQLPPANEPGNEWIEIFNNTLQTISLNPWESGYKVGDEETYDVSDVTEGMERFPSGTIAPGAVITWANNGSLAGFPPNYEITGSPATDTVLYGNPGPPDNDWDPDRQTNLANGGDEVLILDPFDTVVDVVTWGSGSWLGVTAHPGVSAPGRSLHRLIPGLDTDDCSTDIAERFPPTPGNPQFPVNVSVFTVD